MVLVGIRVSAGTAVLNERPYATSVFRIPHYQSPSFLVVIRDVGLVLAIRKGWTLANMNRHQLGQVSLLHSWCNECILELARKATSRQWTVKQLCDKERDQIMSIICFKTNVAIGSEAERLSGSCRTEWEMSTLSEQKSLSEYPSGAWVNAGGGVLAVKGLVMIR